MERPRKPDYNKEKTFYWDYVFDLNRYIEILERKIKINELKTIAINNVFCGCIDKCSSKTNEYYCKSKRKCIHKLKDC